MMKRIYVFSFFIIFTVLLFFSCDLSGINRNWTGSCTTIINDGFNVQYTGIVESFSFNSNGACTLEVLDGFLGNSTRKYYTGFYTYDSSDHYMDFSLTLEEIDDMPVSDNLNYDLDGSDSFDMESETGHLDGTITNGFAGDIPAGVTITISFNLSAE